MKDRHGHDPSGWGGKRWAWRQPSPGVSLRATVPEWALPLRRAVVPRVRDAGGEESRGPHRALRSLESTCTRRRSRARPSCQGGFAAGSRAARRSAFRIACREFPGSCGWPGTPRRRRNAEQVAGLRAGACACSACPCLQPATSPLLALLRRPRLELRSWRARLAAPPPPHRELPRPSLLPDWRRSPGLRRFHFAPRPRRARSARPRALSTWAERQPRAAALCSR